MRIAGKEGRKEEVALIEGNTERKRERRPRTLKRRARTPPRSEDVAATTTRRKVQKTQRTRAKRTQRAKGGTRREQLPRTRREQLPRTRRAKGKEKIRMMTKRRKKAKEAGTTPSNWVE